MLNAQKLEDANRWLDKAEETTAILDFIEARAAVFAKADAA